MLDVQKQDGRCDVSQDDGVVQSMIDQRRLVLIQSLSCVKSIMERVGILTWVLEVGVGGGIVLAIEVFGEAILVPVTVEGLWVEAILVHF